MGNPRTLKCPLCLKDASGPVVRAPMPGRPDEDRYWHVKCYVQAIPDDDDPEDNKDAGNEVSDNG